MGWHWGAGPCTRHRGRGATSPAAYCCPGTSGADRGQPPARGSGHRRAVPKPTTVVWQSLPDARRLRCFHARHRGRQPGSHARARGIIVYYRPDLCDQACVGQLQLAYSSAPKSQRYGVVKMTLAPWLDMDQAVTAAAWGWIDGMDQPDVQRILAFYREHVDRGPEDAL